MNEIKQWTEFITESVGRVVLGKREVIEKLLVALLCRGHVLLEDVPGVGKTILARAMSLSLGGEFRRVQCTADLLPAGESLGTVGRTGNAATPHLHFELRVDGEPVDPSMHLDR